MLCGYFLLKTKWSSRTPFARSARTISEFHTTDNDFPHLYTYVGESQLTLLPNSSQETAPIGTNDIPLDSYGHLDQAHGVRFPEFFATLE